MRVFIHVLTRTPSYRTALGEHDDYNERKAGKLSLSLPAFLYYNANLPNRTPPKIESYDS